MSILHGKEHREPYRGAKAVDKTCRNHGSCAEGRKHKAKRQMPEEDMEAIESLYRYRERLRNR